MSSNSEHQNMTTMTSDSAPSSPHSRLLPSSLYPTSITKNNVPRSSYSVTLSPLFAIRILGTILSLTSFIILVIDGGHAFIATDIFLAFVMIYNALMVLQHSITHVFKVTVELRGSESDSWRHDLGAGRRKARPSGLFDIGLSVCLMICLVIGNMCVRRWQGSGAWRAAVVLGWFVIILQALLAVPSLENKSLTLTAKFNDLDDKMKLDSKLPAHAPATRSPAAGAAGATADDLV